MRRIFLYTYTYTEHTHLHTHTQPRWCILLLASGPVLTRRVQEHTYQSVSSTAPKAFLNASLSALSSLVLFSRGIQSKFALHTIWNILSSHSPPRYAFEAKNYRHFFNEMPKHKWCASGNGIRGIYLEQRDPPWNFNTWLILGSFLLFFHLISM